MKRWAWAAFWTAAVIYGSGFMFISVAVRQLNPVELVFLRAAISSSLLWVVALVTRQHIPRDITVWLWLAFLGIFNLVLPFSLVAWAQRSGVSSGLASLLIATNPLFTLAIAHFAFTDERITLPKLLGLLIGFVGLILLATRENTASSEGVTLLHYSVIILSAISFAFASIASRRLSQRGVTPYMMTAGTITAAVPLLVLLTYVILPSSGEFPRLITEMRLETIGAVLALVFGNTISGYNLSYFTIRELGATTSSSMVYVIAPISLVLGAVFLNEALDARVLFGGAIILVGIAISHIPPEILRRRTPATITAGD